MAESAGQAPAEHSCAAWRAEAVACPLCSLAIWPPATHRLVVPTLGPDDVIVIEAPEKLSPTQKESLHAMCAALWPGHKVALFDGGLSVKVLGRSAT